VENNIQTIDKLELLLLQKEKIDSRTPYDLMALDKILIGKKGRSEIISQTKG
jgi:hypothetical protein